ncbi:PAS-domain containing protein [Yoonia sp. F2084L]|uniref:PAS-domain containing protein n=1 Tax=Yoonia sp. F2084L TaxID=2926419 RepID=UPI001FF3877A|nr:PAS-domain containing protein [Yoonia sp. F2084L]MCK0095102.1 PAS-domain containing protein [Yoonia sp. F2084L]
MSPTHETLTQAGLNLISQAISIYDQDLRLVLANRQFQRMFDLPKALVEPGGSFEETLRILAERGDYGVLDDVDCFLAERVAQAKAFEPHYFERTRANGTTISVEGSPLEGGGWVAVYSDITELKTQEALLRSRSDNLSEELISRSEELARANRTLTATVTALEEAKRQLLASQARLNLTNSMIPAHIARVNRDGVYTYTNHKLNSIVPGRSNDIVGKHMSDALGQEVYEKISDGFAATLRGDAPVVEFEHKEAGRYNRVAFTPDVNDDGEVVGAYLLSANVTEQVRARQALAHTKRRELAAQLTSGLAHDFGNLLTIILGEQDRLARLDDMPQDALTFLETIKSAARRGGDLIAGLGELDAQRSINIRLTDFAGFLKQTTLLAKAATPDDITLTVINKVSASHLMIDAGFAQDALLNLVLNAIDAIEGAGAVTVTVLVDAADYLTFCVEDTGSGFSQDALANALAPFFTSKSDRAGRGLGLSTTFDFARSSGGTVRLANRKEGGAQVSMLVPYLPADPVVPGVVLLVEDNVDIRQTVRGYLQRMGHAVVEADTVEEAQKLAVVGDITFVVTDLMLKNGGTGFALAEHLRKRRSDLPVLIVTGLPQSDPQCQLAAKTYPILRKPFEFDALVTEMNKATRT